jgi:hypothetical protein
MLGDSQMGGGRMFVLLAHSIMLDGKQLLCEQVGHIGRAHIIKQFSKTVQMMTVVCSRKYKPVKMFAILSAYTAIFIIDSVCFYITTLWIWWWLYVAVVPIPVSVLGYTHTGAQQTQQTDAAHRDKILFPLLAMWHRTLIRTGCNGERQWRLGGEYLSPRPTCPSDSAFKISLS